MQRQLERARESLDIPRNDHPAILRICTLLLPPWSQQVPQSYSFFITLPVLIRIDVLFKYNMWIYMTLTCCYFLLKFFCQVASVHSDMP